MFRLARADKWIAGCLKRPIVLLWDLWSFFFLLEKWFGLELNLSIIFWNKLTSCRFKKRKPQASSIDVVYWNQMSHNVWTTQLIIFFIWFQWGSKLHPRSCKRARQFLERKATWTRIPRRERVWSRRGGSLTDYQIHEWISVCSEMLLSPLWMGVTHW